MWLFNPAGSTGDFLCADTKCFQLLIFVIIVSCAQFKITFNVCDDDRFYSRYWSEQTAVANGLPSRNYELNPK